MMLQWFNAREASEIGNSLADKFVAQTADSSTDRDKPVQELLRHADGDTRTSRLNMFKRAKLANAFKWRLLEKGIEKNIADEVTHKLVLHLSLRGSDNAQNPGAIAVPAAPAAPASTKELLARGNECFEQGAFAEAAAIYRELVGRHPRHGVGYRNLGAALFKLGRYTESEASLRKAVELDPNNYESYGTLGTLLRLVGRTAESEAMLRRALKLNPKHADARASLGETLLLLGRVRDAKARFEKVLKSAPRHVQALLGTAKVAQMEGQFEEAAAIYGRVLAIHPKMPQAWAALPGLSKMTAADSDWLKTAEEIVAGGIPPDEESTLRFAMGKYLDDVKEYPRAFENFKRANDLQKAAAPAYLPDVRTGFVDSMIRSNTRDAIAHAVGGSDSVKPVFVVGMARSGTSLTEQIVASHPAVRGAGELLFWTDAAREHEAAIERGVLDEATRKKLAEDYLHVLADRAPGAERVIDKAPFNCDFLGVIHTVFPKARIIYMQRDPVDTCLSCYFQPFSAAINFNKDLANIAHYYREHQRLMAHWRAVLPAGTILDVPYEQLVADPNLWIHKILEFLGLEWNDRCLDFNKTQRLVATASYWQVRQRVYKTSVARWRHYEKFIGPLLQLNA
jgi:tetratricopeptide (TPR) repeat protein